MVVMANQEKVGLLRIQGRWTLLGKGPWPTVTESAALGTAARPLARQRGPWHGSAALCARRRERDGRGLPRGRSADAITKL